MRKKRPEKPAESITYNTRVRTFPDGTQQYYKSSNKYHRAGDEEKAVKKAWDEWYNERFGLPEGWDDAPSPLHDGSSVERKESDNMKRAIQMVHNIAKSNVFDWFVTFTFNPDVVDSFDYDSCVVAIRAWMNSARQRGLRWLVVPEQHKSGRYHFHALVTGELKAINAVNAHTGLPMLTKSGLPIYNVGDYSWGFTQATRVRDKKAVSSYIAKYLAKGISVPKGRKRYWASYGLERPAEDFQTMNDWDFAELVAKAKYFADRSNEWGNFWLAELEPD